MASGRTEGLSADPVLLKIDAVRRSAALWTMGWGYLWTALLIVCMIFAGVLLDHAFLLQKWGRLAFFDAFAFSLGGAALVATLFPLVKRIGRLYVARRMEAQRPELKNALISYLQCRDDPTTPREIKRMLRRRAVGSIRSLNAAVVVDARRYGRLTAAVCSIVLIFFVYAIVSPKSALVSVRRLMRPRADILPPTSTRLAQVEPGELYVIAGEEPRLKVTVEGATPDSVCAVWYGQSFEDRRILLERKGASRWEGSFPPILEDGGYYLIAGDTRSDAFGIKALPPPAVVALELTLAPPAYTGLATRKVNDGNVDVLSGTVIGVRASTNLPPQTGCVEFDSGRRVWLTSVAGESALGGQFTAVRSDGYVVRFESIRYPNGASFKNQNPVRYRITCREDSPPSVTLTGPEDGLKALPSDRVVLTYSARDDFAVARVRLRHNLNDLVTAATTIAEPGVPRIEAASYEWDLSTTSARRGTVITYYLEVEDNRPRLPQVARSETRRIVIPGLEALPVAGVPPGERRLAEPEAQPKPGAQARPEARPAGQAGESATGRVPSGEREKAENPAGERRALQEYARRIAELLGREPGPQEPGAAGQAQTAAGPERTTRPEGPVAASEDRARATRTAESGPAGRTAAAETRAPETASPEAAQTPEGRPAAPREGVQDAAPREGVQDAAPREGVQDAAPREGAQDAAPREGVQDVARASRAAERASGTARAEEARPDESRPASGEPGGGRVATGDRTGTGGPEQERGTAPDAARPAEVPGLGSAGQPGGPTSGTGGGEASAGAGGPRAGSAGGQDTSGGGAQPAPVASGSGSAGSAQGGGAASPGQGDGAMRAGSGAAAAGQGAGAGSGAAGGTEPGAGSGGAGRQGESGGPAGAGGVGTGGVPAGRGARGPGGRPGTGPGGPQGTGVTQLPVGGAREGRRPPADPDSAVEELARMIEEDRLPAEMLRDLGTNREALRDFVERYRQANRSQPEGAVPEGAEIVRDGGRVMQGAQAAAPDVAARDALSAESARDALRSRFEGASERLSPRYREVVDRYYRMLSEER
jgi:hypothetical protein